jgi:hypothetical protein
MLEHVRSHLNTVLHAKFLLQAVWYGTLEYFSGMMESRNPIRHAETSVSDCAVMLWAW